MLLQLEDTHPDDINKLLAFAKTNNLKLSLVENDDNYLLPGKPLNEEKLMQLIRKSRNGKILSLEDAHSIISNGFHAD